MNEFIGTFFGSFSDNPLLWLLYEITCCKMNGFDIPILPLKIVSCFNLEIEYKD